MDFIEKEIISLKKIRFLVLDEADRMLDMGFKDAVDQIMSTTSQSDSGQRQTLMFSATFPEEIRKLARTYLKDSIFLKIGLVGGACADVTQTFFEVEKVLSKKRDKLMEILNESDPKGTQNQSLVLSRNENKTFLSSFIFIRNNGFRGNKKRR